jgi:hypothetical protein
MSLRVRCRIAMTLCAWRICSSLSAIGFAWRATSASSFSIRAESSAISRCCSGVFVCSIFSSVSAASQTLAAFCGWRQNLS